MIIGVYTPIPRSGKGTFAKECQKLYGDTYVVSFADIMRECIVKVSAPFLEGGEEEAWEWINDDRKDTQIIPDLGVTQRRMLQTLGTEWGRIHIHPDIWVKILAKRIEEIEYYYFETPAPSDKPPLIVVDDLRYPNEYLFLQPWGAKFVAIVRDDAPLTETHTSNGLLDGYDFHHIIENTSVAGVRQGARSVLIKEGIINL